MCVASIDDIKLYSGALAILKRRIAAVEVVVVITATAETFPSAN